MGTLETTGLVSKEAEGAGHLDTLTGPAQGPSQEDAVGTVDGHDYVQNISSITSVLGFPSC